MTEQPAFLDLPDLASDTVGGAAIACNDEFFAEKENLLRAHVAVWKEHEYTDRGKWMDGWETRRRRDGGTHDWCVVRLGLPGVIRGIVVDTAFFRGNYPEACAIYATTIEDPLDLAALQRATWSEILPRSALRGDSKNVFAIADGHRYTHVRLDIYPDGGVARLRVHGDVVPGWPRLRALGGPIDLAALEHGAVVETCSDMFFGSRNNLIKPGPSRSMADGWETRRRRGPGNDWAIIRLAAAGTVESVEIDTSHFKGNAPGRIALEGTHAPGASVDELSGWRTLLATAVEPHRRHVFDHQLRRTGPITHLRISVFPCGGIARLRAWGTLVPEAAPGLAALDAMSVDDARAALRKCCGSSRWAEQVAAARPFEDVPALLRIAERVWWSLGEADHREAFSAHPKIGSQSPPAQPAGDPETTGRWARDEQQTTASAAAATLAELADANRAYEAKHGFIYIVCATGRGADDMLADLRARLAGTTKDELRTAAEEQAKITRLRLAKLLAEHGGHG
ncbi:MAG: allantoicase [Deltaproteobacteria bacterium]|nr:allantoicase [Deltaproteobacteria bacterium]